MDELSDTGNTGGAGQLLQPLGHSGCPTVQGDAGNKTLDALVLRPQTEDPVGLGRYLAPYRVRLNEDHGLDLDVTDVKVLRQERSVQQRKRSEPGIVQALRVPEVDVTVEDDGHIHFRVAYCRSWI